MKIYCFADLRTTVDLPKEQPDLVILLGDIPQIMVGRIDRAYQCKKIGVYGNHDASNGFKGTDIESIHEKVIQVNGVNIAGYGGSPSYNSRKFGQHSQEDAHWFCRSLENESIDLFISHSNPVYPDYETDDTHGGFKAFNELFRVNAIPYALHGHLHDRFVQELYQTQVHCLYQLKIFDYDPNQKSIIKVFENEVQ